MPFLGRIKELAANIRQFRLREDRAILITCMGIALIFWILVKLSQTYRTEKEVAFSFSLPDKKAFTALPPGDVEVELEGTGWDLLYEFLSSSKVTLRYDLGDIPSFSLNRGQLRNEISNALAANGLKVIEVNYDNLSFKLENKITKKVPVRLQAHLNLSPEYHLRDPIIIKPDSISLTGPSSLVNSYTEWPTDSVRLLNLKYSVEQEIPLAAAPPEISLMPGKVLLNLSVETFTEKALFVPVIIKNAPEDSIKIFPDKIKLTFSVGLSQFNEVDFQDFVIEADLKEIPLAEGKTTVPVAITRQPPFIKNVTLSRKSVEFYIFKGLPRAEGPRSGTE